MTLNDVALARLAGLKRGEVLPYVPPSDCPGCGFRTRRKKCPNCKGEVPKPCRLCRRPIPKRRQVWCGDECLDAYFLSTSSSHVRMKAWDRDRGVCAKCGIDTDAIERRVNRLERGDARRAALAVLNENGFNVGVAVWSSCPSLWDADHVEPLDEGGSWRMENVQTLCHQCHKEKTAEQASRRGKQGRLLGRKWRRTQALLRLAGAGRE